MEKDLKKRYKYMHTINYRPAYFDGEQICYASNYVEKLCDSLKQIREEQKLTIKQRIIWGFDMKEDCDKYGYVKVIIE